MISLSAVDGNPVLCFTGISRFTLHSDRIECHVSRPSYAYLVEIQLLGLVLALWLEQRGTPALHASAVTVGGRVAAFIGGKGAGKTSTAAAFLKGGSALVTEDLLALQPGPTGVVCHAGYPQMRMWPAEAEHFVPDVNGLEVIHPGFTKVRVPVGAGGIGSFSPDPLPLGGLYILKRGDANGHVRVTPLSQQQATIELVRYSFVPELVQALGLQPKRLASLAQIAGHVPLLRLEYPTGLERLPEVLNTITHNTAAS